MMDNKEKKLDIKETLIKACKDDGRYKPESFCFVGLCYLNMLRSKAIELEGTKNKLPKMDCSELLTFFKFVGWDSFGFLTKNVFNHWGLKSGKDFLNIINCLVDKGIIDKTTLKKNGPDCYVLKDFSFDYFQQKGIMKVLG